MHLSDEYFRDDETERTRQLLEAAQMGQHAFTLTEPPEGFIEAAVRDAEHLGLLGTDTEPRYPYVFVPAGVPLRALMGVINQFPLQWVGFGDEDTVTANLWVASAELHRRFDREVDLELRWALRQRIQTNARERAIALSTLFAWSFLRSSVELNFPPGAVLHVTPNTSVVQSDRMITCVQGQ